MTVHALFPYLRVHDCGAAIAFYSEVFGATEKFRLTEPNGRVGHAELDFNGSILMLSDEFPEYGMPSARTIGASPVALHLHVDDADAVIERALGAGATLEMPVQDHFYGERSGNFRDPFGHVWNVGHHIEEVSPDEMQRRYTAMFSSD